MPDEYGGFTVEEFTEACRARDVLSRAYIYSHRASVAFLEHLRRHGLLHRENGRYYATQELCSILDAPPLPLRIPLPLPEENDAHARARRRPSWVEDLFSDTS